jgi:hypothetical protein
MCFRGKLVIALAFSFFAPLVTHWSFVKDSHGGVQLRSEAGYSNPAEMSFSLLAAACLQAENSSYLR